MAGKLSVQEIEYDDPNVLLPCYACSRKDVCDPKRKVWVAKIEDEKAKSTEYVTIVKQRRKGEDVFCVDSLTMGGNDSSTTLIKLASLRKLPERYRRIVEYAVYRMARLTFYTGAKGNTIARMPTGKIALIDKRSVVDPKPGETWICAVVVEKETFAIVAPIARVA